MNEPHPGILSRIKRATSEAEIDALLEEGQNYSRASERTRNRWVRKAKKRKAEIQNEH